jgi:membrane-associated phospholipid phosphatase
MRSHGSTRPLRGNQTLMTTSDPRVVRSGARAAWLIGAALTAGWVGLLVWVRSTAPDIPALDADLHDWAVETRTPGSIAVADAVSVLGQVNVAVPLAVLGVVLVETVTRRWGRRRAAAVMAVLAGGGCLIGLAMNYAVGRERPVPDAWAGAAGGPSFPSGHTTAATVAALLLAWAITRVVTARPAQVAVWVAAAAWAVGVGWSRVWLGVHWPTDVLCAWLFVPSLLVLGRAAQLTWWPADAPPTEVLEPVDAPAPADTEVRR